MEKRINEIDKVYNKILNNGLLFGSLLGFVAYALSLINYNAEVLSLSLYTDGTILLFFIVTYFYKNKISIEAKSLVIIFGIVGFVIPDLLKLGLQSENKILLILIPFFSFLGFSFRRIIITYALVVFIYLICAYAVINQLVIQYDRLPVHQVKFASWLIDIVIITIVSLIFVIVVKQFHAAFFNLINDLKDKNAALTESESNYRGIFNSSADAIFIHDLHGNLLDVNHAMLKMYGYSQSDIATLNLDDLSASEDDYSREKALNNIAKAIENGRAVFDWKGRRKDGSVFWVEVSLIRADIGGRERVLALVRDNDEKKKNAIQLEIYKQRLEELVKERTNDLEEVNEELSATNNYLNVKNDELSTAYDKLKNAQERMIHNEKLASLGLLATGVAHEINNPLNFIQGGVIGLENYFKDNCIDHPKDIDDLLFAIKEGVRRSAVIVRSLNHFSRGTDGARKVKCNLHQVIEECLVILNNQHKGRIDVKKNYTNQDVVLDCNEGQLHQVFLNLLTNAAQAIVGEGVIQIDTQRENGKISICIIDSGCGIEENLLDKITEPFFTTKSAGEGTGLGLSITSNIVHDHNGKLLIQSKKGKGTKVCIEFLVAS